MQKHWLTCVLAALRAACGGAGEGTERNIADELDGMQALPGFLDMYWDKDGGRLLLAIEEFDAELLYQSSLARGVGSNDLGLDRGQLGATRIVRFERSGPKVLLVEETLRYRARSRSEERRVGKEWR